MARAWAAARGRDFDHDLRNGSFLSLTDVEVLADHLMLSVEAQAAANAHAATLGRPRRVISRLERLRPSQASLAALSAVTNAGSAFARIRWVARYIKWHLA
jgi:hypothetical protein